MSKGRVKIPPGLYFFVILQPDGVKGCGLVTFPENDWATRQDGVIRTCLALPQIQNSG